MKIDNAPIGHGSVKYVSTDWLEKHLDDVFILDVQPNPHDYFLQHIPGSVYLSPNLQRATKDGQPAVYLEPHQLAELFARVGIDSDTTVVLYTHKGDFKNWGDGLEQPFMAYTLIRFGAKEVYVLDGGLEKWISEGKPLSQEFPEVKATKFKADAKEEMKITIDELIKIKDQDDVILLDARPPHLYKGEGTPWIKDGHIPGAVNLPWANLMHPDNPRLLKELDEIKAIAEKAGATPDKQIICSCGTGREATNEYLIFKHLLGYERVQLYEGSFTEWSADPDRPVVKGSKPYE
ncbi:MAG: putative thiosulfate sulfurtransferase [Candidatus Thorarchaeota archaeon]|nr:MAG: putative thiosulfate sulfurtransferase [Candidatus Thorarchaeota archaeon]